MRTAVIIDWLGRGGIAQLSDTWRRELEARAIAVTVVTRDARELADSFAAPRRAARAGRAAAHLEVVHRAVSAVEALRPDVVVVQNYVVPALEEQLYRAAGASGAHVVAVVHDHRLHSPLAGTRLGLSRCLRLAGSVWCHSHFVAEVVTQRAGVQTTVVPLPLPVGMLEVRPVAPAVADADALLALHFGVLRRRYKGSAVIRTLATRPSRWRFAVVGSGALAMPPPHVSVEGYVSIAELMGWLDAADAVVLPYRYATQSGAVLLAQAKGKPVIASAVGGIAEQISSGETGLLVPADASVDDWSEALESLAPLSTRRSMGAAAQASVTRRHAEFLRALDGLAG